MEFTGITQVAFASAGAAATILFFSMLILRHVAISRCLLIAVFTHALWLFSVAAFGKFSYINIETVVFLESLHFSIWIIAFVQTTEKASGYQIPKKIKVLLYSFLFVLTVFPFVAAPLTQTPKTLIEILNWQGILFSVTGLSCLEQMFRNGNRYRMLKLLSLSMVAVFAFDTYFFSHNLIYTSFSGDLWQMRAAVSLIATILMAISVLAFHNERGDFAELTLSRPAVFYTTSLTIAGSLMIIIGLAGYYIKIWGGSWATVIYATLLFSGLLFLGVLFASKSVRENLNVLINKHLFSHKYDYRAEWLKIIDKLNRPVKQDEIYSRAIEVVADVFKCHGGAIWLKHGKVYIPVKQKNLSITISNAIEAESTEFCRLLLEEEWIFALNNDEQDCEKTGSCFPEWAKEISDIWLIMPLICEDRLIGFMSLSSPQAKEQLNWEDLDLLRTVGRQVASFLERQVQSEMLTESRQFEAFNKLSAYVMHDLKNLIAQQSLVVTNAAKHKDNPAFVADAISTIENSVERMNNLLRKLKQTEEDEIKSLTVKEILVEAVKRCRNSLPKPSIMPINEQWRIKGAQDTLVMLFAHIIQNAQDATPSDGYVDISAAEESGILSVFIEDNGCGMDDDFIRNRLFKPFETTKSGKGMGIGVHQAREYAHNIGGNISVDSSPGEGSTFIINLPLHQA